MMVTLRRFIFALTLLMMAATSAWAQREQPVTIQKAGDAWTFTMPNGPVAVTPVYAEDMLEERTVKLTFTITGVGSTTIPVAKGKPFTITPTIPDGWTMTGVTLTDGKIEFTPTADVSYTAELAPNSTINQLENNEKDLTIDGTTVNVVLNTDGTKLTVKGAAGKKIALYDAGGALLKESNDDTDTKVVNTGQIGTFEGLIAGNVYYLKIGDATWVKVVRQNS